MLPSALDKEWSSSSYFSGFQNVTASAVRLQLSLIVRGQLPVATLLYAIFYVSTGFSYM